MPSARRWTVMSFPMSMRRNVQAAAVAASSSAKRKGRSADMFLGMMTGCISAAKILFPALFRSTGSLSQADAKSSSASRRDVSGGWVSWCAGLGILRNIANYSQFAKLCVIFAEDKLRLRQAASRHSRFSALRSTCTVFVKDIFARTGRVPAVFGAIRRCDGTVRSAALQA